MSRSAVKSEIDVIEIEDDDQTEVKQECEQTSQNIAFECALPEFEQNHNPPAIDQIFLEAMLDPTDHPALTDCQPTLSSVINQLFGISEESTKEQEVAPNGDLGHLNSINLCPDAVASTIMENNCEIKTTEHFHATSKKVHVSDLSRAIMTTDQASDNGNTQLSEQNEIHSSVDSNALGVITPMPIPTEISPSKRAKMPNKQIGSNASKPSITQMPILDDETPLRLRLRGRKQINYCGADSKSRGTIIIDQMRHQCSYCSYSTNCTDNLHKHIRTHTGEKPFKCVNCSYSATSNDALQKHMRTHTGERPYKCRMCSYACADSSTLTRHTRTHTGKKPYKCDQCVYACAASCALKSHMRIHTGEKPYKCGQCSYACAQPGSLKIHMRTHTGEKPYKCNQCSYASAQPSDLKTHIRTHTGEKPYKCEQCSYAFAAACQLKMHMRTHTGEKPYKCCHCSYACAQAIHLRNHIRTHFVEKPYKCDQCSYTCAVSSSLKSHMRTHV